MKFKEWKAGDEAFLVNRVWPLFKGNRGGMVNGITMRVEKRGDISKRERTRNQRRN